eukprot:Mycagemm_TRINITY_DN10296_c0_g3::TRINITY_DN10296_c0_g3_i5::g.4348::m.4348 type:complete len:133 gc:universal TRINITY_DN10296_c0_g3_i5:488-90(-)
MQASAPIRRTSSWQTPSPRRAGSLTPSRRAHLMAKRIATALTSSRFLVAPSRPWRPRRTSATPYGTELGLRALAVVAPTSRNITWSWPPLSLLPPLLLLLRLVPPLPHSLLPQALPRPQRAPSSTAPRHSSR